MLTRLGVAAALGPRGVAVLTALVKNRHQPMAKKALIEAAWPGLVVEEANLSVQMSAIRRVLAQAAGGEGWIETLARRGYRFVGPVTELRGGVTYEERQSVPGNLPKPIASFVGREQELAELKRLLAKNRVLTVVGPGGVGKTRIAVQLAAEVADAYRDGVWFVDLAPVADPHLVASAVAQVFEVHHTPGKSLVDEVARHLEAKRALILFDNCEHIIDASVRLVEAILRGAAGAAVVATSREPLRAEGEQLYWLQALPLPGPGEDVEAIRKSDAITLFVDRAQHQQPDFALTNANASAVARLCRRLDGIPLALELAAPLAHTYSIDEIDARLADRFDALPQSRRTAPPRQQTLRATLDWSYELLSEQQRTVLRRVSILAGNFTLATAAEVASDGSLQASRIGEPIAELVARSLLIGHRSDGAMRYNLLDTTRSYGREKLEQAGEKSAVQRRCAERYRRVVDAATDEWLRLPDEEWRARYLPEIDNVRSAIDWSSSQQGGTELAIALAGGSGPIWTSMSLYAEGIARLGAVAGRPLSTRPRSDNARLWLWLGLLLEPSEPARAVSALQRAVAFYRAIANVEGLAQSATCLARALAIAGKYDESANALATALPALKRSGRPRLRAMYFANAAMLKSMTNDSVGAQALYRSALAVYRQVGSALGTAGSLNNLANVSWASGDLETAEQAFREAVDMHRGSRHGGKDPLGFALGNLAGVLTERGKLAEALEAAREGLPLLRSAGNAWLFIDHVAMRSALAGKTASAAQLAGFADRMYAGKRVREPNEARARERLETLLREDIPGDRLTRLLAEGAKLSEEDAYRIALED